MLYVIILSAALDLVPPSTPKGIIAFCNIAPALIAKIGWPYLLKGRIRYAKRLLGCCTLSSVGMLVSVIVTHVDESSTHLDKSRSSRSSTPYTLVCWEYAWLLSPLVGALINMRQLITEHLSGLGELTFLQLSTTYAPPSIAGRSIG